MASWQFGQLCLEDTIGLAVPQGMDAPTPCDIVLIRTDKIVEEWVEFDMMNSPTDHQAPTAFMMRAVRKVKHGQKTRLG